MRRRQTTPTRHAHRHASGGVDDLTGTLDATARVIVKKGVASGPFTRRAINLIDGAGITITIADDSANEEVDLTVSTGIVDDVITGTVQTTDATVTTCGSYTLADQYAAKVSVDVIALVNDAASAAGFVLTASFLRDGAGVTQVGVTTIVVSEKSAALSLATATIDASGTAIRVRIAGIAATTVRWVARGRVVLVGA